MSKSSGTVELMIISGLLGGACFLPFILTSDQCTTDPNAPPERQCVGSGSSGHSGGSSSGGHYAGSERGGFGNSGRGFSLFS